MSSEFFLYIAAGFAAQLIDGTLGQALAAKVVLFLVGGLIVALGIVNIWRYLAAG